MNIYTCVDKDNIEKIMVLFYSCLINCSKKEDLKFYLLIDEPTNYKIPKIFENKLKIKSLDKNLLKDNGWLDLIDEFSKIFYVQGAKCNHIMNFSRFFIFDHFPEIDVAVYLDWDMIVQDDIFKLYDYYYDCKERNTLVIAECNCWDNVANNILNFHYLVQTKMLKGLNGANSRTIGYLKKKVDREWKILIDEYQKKLTFTDVDIKGKTFNAGFSIVCKYVYRTNYLKELISNLINFQKENNCFRFGTQVILNLLTKNKIFVDEKWNCKDKSSSIVHWSGRDKPWDNNDELWFSFYNKYNSI